MTETPAKLSITNLVFELAIEESGYFVVEQKSGVVVKLR